MLSACIPGIFGVLSDANHCPLFGSVSNRLLEALVDRYEQEDCAVVGFFLAECWSMSF